MQEFSFFSALLILAVSIVLSAILLFLSIMDIINYVNCVSEALKNELLVNSIQKFIISTIIISIGLSLATIIYLLRNLLYKNKK